MPYYLFENPETKEVREVFFKMNDFKSFHDQSGLEWTRVYTLPKIGIDTMIDPHSSSAFINKTNKAGTIGEVYDLSKEMSEKRGGEKNDEIKINYNKNWKKKRGVSQDSMNPE